MEIESILRLSPRDINQFGQGVAEWNGRVIFVDGLLPGDTADCRITDLRSNYGVARPVKMIEPSPDRRAPFCPLFPACGGCTLQHLDYAAQLRWKRHQVVSALTRIGGFDGTRVEQWVGPVKGMAEPMAYRNKVQFPVGVCGAEAAKTTETTEATATAGTMGAVGTAGTAVPEGAAAESAAALASLMVSSVEPHPAPAVPAIGFYQMGSHRICDGDSCPIGHPAADLVRRSLREHMVRHCIPAYDERQERGLVRHVLIRVGFETRQVMVCPVLTADALPCADEWIAGLSADLSAVGFSLTSVYFNINARPGNRVLSDDYRLIWGAPRLSETLLGLTHAISPASFFQVNPLQTAVLYTEVLRAAALQPDETAFDVYCGTGSIALQLARHCRQVIGNELIPQAVADAEANARLNGIENVRFYAGRAEAVIPKLCVEGLRADCAVVDPPRKGCDERLLRTLLDMVPERLVYVSCNPATLARDLKVLAGRFEPVSVQPVDMFPWTTHVETVVLLSHKAPDSHINVKVEFGEGKGKVPLDKIAERAEKYKPKEKVTYKKIKEYIEEKYGFKVHTAYIAEVKRAFGLPMYDAPNAVEKLKNRKAHPTKDKVRAITDALIHFELISKKEASAVKIAHLSAI